MAIGTNSNAYIHLSGEKDAHNVWSYPLEASQGGRVRRDTAARAVGQRIRQIRKAAGLTLEKLAERAGIDPAFLGGVERGVENPTFAWLIKIADTLRVPLASLLDIEGR